MVAVDLTAVFDTWENLLHILDPSGGFTRATSTFYYYIGEVFLGPRFWPAVAAAGRIRSWRIFKERINTLYGMTEEEIEEELLGLWPKKEEATGDFVLRV